MGGGYSPFILSPLATPLLGYVLRREKTEAVSVYG